MTDIKKIQQLAVNKQTELFEHYLDQYEKTIDTLIYNSAVRGFRMLVLFMNDGSSYHSHTDTHESFVIIPKMYRILKKKYRGAGFKVRRNLITRNITISW